MYTNVSHLVPSECFVSQNPPIYAANNEKINHVRKLREKWTCTKGPECGSTFCFVDPETQTHIPLGHDHFDGWALAMVRHIAPRV